MKVTTENYKKVLNKMERRFHKYKTICIRYHINSDGKKFWKHSIGWYIKNDYKECLEGKRKKPKKKLKFYNGSNFIHITQHRFVDSDFSLDKEQIEKYGNVLIHMDLGTTCGKCIYEYDRVYLLPFGITIVSTDERILTDLFKGEKQLFIPDIFKGKINLEEEIEKRDKEWEQDAEYYNKLEDEENDNCCYEENDDLDWYSL